LIIGATNCPEQLDDAARRRFVKRLYIPLPTSQARLKLIQVLLKDNRHTLEDRDMSSLGLRTKGFSGADLKSLCTDAAMGPLRRLGGSALEVRVEDVPSIGMQDFEDSLKCVKPSVGQEEIGKFRDWDEAYGAGTGKEEEED
jgi:SpoVK/Ycf46/Vps4 family AAA+-type ATPase